LHFFTGSHTDYHRPSDDFQHLNIEGMRRVSEFAADLVARIAAAPERLAYVEVEQQPLGDSRPNPRPYFGSIPDFANSGGGYAISGVGPGSPAAEAGLIAGDVIVRLGDYKVGNLEDFDGALRKYEAGDKVPVLVRRANEQVELHVTLDPPR
jgi:S1-C subfamily serine protease